MASSPFQTFVLETDQMSMLRSYKTNVELREGLIDGLNTVLYGRIDHAIVLTQFRGLNGFLRVEMTGNNGTRPLRSSTSNAGLDGFFFDYDGGKVWMRAKYVSLADGKEWTLKLWDKV
jgi:hypothetical protein